MTAQPEYRAFLRMVEVTLPRGGICLALVEAYFDESGAQSGAPVLIVAGYISTTVRWLQFQREWSRFLITHCGGATYFHAKDWISNVDDKIFRRVVSLIQKAIVCGLAVTLKIEDFDDLTTPILRKELGDAYDLCCQLVRDVESMRG